MKTFIAMMMVSASFWAMAQYPNYTVTDWSGDVEIAIWSSDSSPSAHPSAVATVHPDYVCVGGGVQTLDTEYGGLLTKSYPLPGYSSWQGQSKDHGTGSSDIHKVRVYAIGLKLNGISASELKQYVTTSTMTSGTANHPNVTSQLPLTHHIIGGGAQVNWSGFGNLLTASYPSGPQSWYAKSKDQETADRCTITAYAIGLETCIPGFGELDFTISNSQGPTVSYGTSGGGLSAETGRVITCPGAYDDTWDWGRLLTNCYPEGANSVYASSKDHNSRADAGYVTIYSIQIQRKPDGSYSCPERDGGGGGGGGGEGGDPKGGPGGGGGGIMW